MRVEKTDSFFFVNIYLAATHRLTIMSTVSKNILSINTYLLQNKTQKLLQAKEKDIYYMSILSLSGGSGRRNGFKIRRW